MNRHIDADVARDEPSAAARHSTAAPDGLASVDPAAPCQEMVALQAVEAPDTPDTSRSHTALVALTPASTSTRTASIPITASTPPNTNPPLALSVPPRATLSVSAPPGLARATWCLDRELDDERDRLDRLLGPLLRQAEVDPRADEALRIHARVVRIPFPRLHALDVRRFLFGPDTLRPQGWGALDEAAYQHVQRLHGWLTSVADAEIVRDEDIAALAHELTTQTGDVWSPQRVSRWVVRYRLGGRWALAPGHDRYAARRRERYVASRAKQDPGTLAESTVRAAVARYGRVADLAALPHVTTAQVREVAAQHDVSERTIWNDLSCVRSHGVAGVARQYRADRGAYHGISTRAVHLVRATALSRPSWSVEQVRAFVEHRALLWGGDDALRAPSASQVRAIIDAIPLPVRQLAAGASHAFRNGSRVVFPFPHSPAVVALQIDHRHPLPLLVRDTRPPGQRNPSGQVRPYLTQAIDTASRVVPAATFSFGPPDRFAVAATIRQALLPSGHNPAAGVPDEIWVDNGKELVAGLIWELCRSLGILLWPGPPRYPEARGIVERLHETLDLQLWSRLEGYTGPLGEVAKVRRDPHDRPPVTARYTLEQVEEWYWEEIDRYNQRPHDALTVDGRKLTPVEYWNEYCLAPPVDDLRLLDVLLLDPEERTVTRRGVKLQGHYYRWSGYETRVGERVVVRSGPADAAPATVEVYGLHPSRYLGTAAREGTPAASLGRDAVRTARRAQRQHIDRQLRDAARTMAQELTQAAPAEPAEAAAQLPAGARAATQARGQVRLGPATTRARRRMLPRPEGTRELDAYAVEARALTPLPTRPPTLPSSLPPLPPHVLASVGPTAQSSWSVPLSGRSLETRGQHGQHGNASAAPLGGLSTLPAEHARAAGQLPRVGRRCDASLLRSAPGAAPPPDEGPAVAPAPLPRPGPAQLVLAETVEGAVAEDTVQDVTGAAIGQLPAPSNATSQAAAREMSPLARLPAAASSPQSTSRPLSRAARTQLPVPASVPSPAAPQPLSPSSPSLVGSSAIDTHAPPPSSTTHVQPTMRAPLQLETGRAPSTRGPLSSFPARPPLTSLLPLLPSAYSGQRAVRDSVDAVAADVTGVHDRATAGGTPALAWYRADADSLTSPLSPAGRPRLDSPVDPRPPDLPTALPPSPTPLTTPLMAPNGLLLAAGSHAGGLAASPTPEGTGAVRARTGASFSEQLVSTPKLIAWAAPYGSGHAAPFVLPTSVEWEAECAARAHPAVLNCPPTPSDIPVGPMGAATRQVLLFPAPRSQGPPGRDSPLAVTTTAPAAAPASAPPALPVESVLFEPVGQVQPPTSRRLTGAGNRPITLHVPASLGSPAIPAIPPTPGVNLAIRAHGSVRAQERQEREEPHVER